MSDKCHLTSDQNCTLCPGMDRALQPQFSPGLWAYILTNFETGSNRMVGIVVATSKSRKTQPTLLNFCPFCGERLLTNDGKPFHDEVQP